MTIPNMITLVRIFLIPVFILVFYLNPDDIKWSILIFILAGFSDILDGYLARKLHEVSNLGKILDPIADKLMVITALVALYIKGRMPFWIVVLVIIKEFVMFLGGSFLLIKKRRDLAANFFGKLGTVFIFLAIFWQAFLLPFRNFFTVVAGIMAVIALINYINMHLHFNE